MILLIWLNYWYCVKLFRIIVVFFFFSGQFCGLYNGHFIIVCSILFAQK